MARLKAIPSAPFDLRTTGGNVLHCREVVRRLPGKRQVCAGSWHGEQVFAKLYHHPYRARKHWERERQGIEKLTAHGIATPALLYAGRHDESGVLLLVTKAVLGANDALAVWREADASGRQHLLSQLVKLIAQHHNSGLYQRDLHLGNFLVHENVIYTLDGSDIVGLDSELGRDASLDNLGLLFAQLSPSFDQWMPDMLTGYLAERGKADDWIGRATMQARVDARRERRKRDYLRKIYRQSTAFGVTKSWRDRTVISTAHAGAPLKEILDKPDDYMRPGVSLLKDGNTSTVASADMGGQKVVIKRYNIKNIWHGLFRAIRPTRASISWRNAHLLRFYGIETARPIALLERRWGPFRRQAYFISEHVQGQTAREWFRSSEISMVEKRQVADRIIGMFRMLARLRIGHGDLKATNIIITDGNPSLNDLDAMHQYTSARLYRRAGRRDARRFMKNWEGDPDIARLFMGLQEI